jgi:hypothetical protein
MTTTGGNASSFVLIIPKRILEWNKMTQPIKVTKEDINNGRAGNSFACPVALAIRRTIDAYGAAVSNDWIITDGNIYRTPLSVVDFIEQFDRGDAVDPFEFTAEPY